LTSFGLSELQKKASIKSAALDELFVPSCMKQISRLHCFNVDDKRGMCRLIAKSSSEALAEESFATDEDIAATVNSLEFSGVHHVGVLCENLEQSMEFYCGLLGKSLRFFTSSCQRGLGTPMDNIPGKKYHEHTFYMESSFHLT
jgi:hypothetical protein